jgi:hypothetical protein
MRTDQEADQIFWERIQDMPHWEAETECVMRREHNNLQIAVLQKALADTGTKTGKRTKHAAEIAAEMAGIMSQNTLINERVKYLRKLQNQIQWKEAVRVVCGQETLDEVMVYIEQTWGQQEREREENRTHYRSLKA